MYARIAFLASSVSLLIAVAPAHYAGDQGSPQAIINAKFFDTFDLHQRRSILLCINAVPLSAPIVPIVDRLKSMDKPEEGGVARRRP